MFGSVRSSSVPALAAPTGLIAVLVASAPAGAEIVATFEVGSGLLRSSVQVDFSNGNGYLFEYLHDGGVSGFDALLAFETWLPEFTLVWKDFGFGAFVTGIGVLGDFEYGTGDLWPEVENYWHYWVQDSGDWQFSMTGASSRQLFDGSFDGWVFGSSASPQPIPAPSVLVGILAGSLFGRFRRRRV